MTKYLNCKGISLVETMVSILVFGILVTGLLSVATQGMKTSKRADLAFTAYNLAKNHVETLKSMPFSSVSSAAETSTQINDFGTPDPDGLFYRSTTVSTSYTGDANLTQVQVSVYYKMNGTMSASPMSLTTVIFQYA